jgi:hypothetical protein
MWIYGYIREVQILKYTWPLASATVHGWILFVGWYLIGLRDYVKSPRHCPRKEGARPGWSTALGFSGCRGDARCLTPTARIFWRPKPIGYRTSKNSGASKCRGFTLVHNMFDLYKIRRTEKIFVPPAAAHFPVSPPATQLHAAGRYNEGRQCGLRWQENSVDR